MLPHRLLRTTAKTRNCLSLCFFALAINGCTTSTALETYSLLQARAGLALEQGSKVAVLAFTENYSSENLENPARQSWILALMGPQNYPPNAAVRGRITASLNSLRVASRPFFRVVERKFINRVMEEQNLVNAGVLTSDNLIASGKLLGVEYILTGNSDLQLKKIWTTVDHNRCALMDSNREQCLRVQIRTVRCEIREAHASLLPRLLRVDNSQILYSSQIEASRSENACNQEYDPWALKPPYEVMFSNEPTVLGTQAIDTVIGEMMRDIAPYYASVKLHMIRTLQLKDPILEKHFDFVMKLMRSDLSSGCSELRKLLTGPAHRDASIVFNTAICDEMAGKLEAARQVLLELRGRYAEEQLDIPEFLIDALKRIDEKIANRASLRASRPEYPTPDGSLPGLEQ